MTRMLPEIDERLLAEVQRLTKARTSREAIETALREFVRHRRVKGHMTAAGTSSVRWTAANIRKMRGKR